MLSSTFNHNSTVPPVAKKRQYCTELLNFLHGALYYRHNYSPLHLSQARGSQAVQHKSALSTLPCSLHLFPHLPPLLFRQEEAPYPIVHQVPAAPLKNQKNWC